MNLSRWMLPLAFVLCLSGRGVSQGRAQGEVSTWRPSNVALQILRLINADRVRHNVGTVRLSLSESPCSYRHSTEMARAGRLYHDLPGDICISAAWYSENVGYTVVLRDRDGGSTYSRLYRGIGLEQAMVDEGPCPALPCSPQEWELHGHYYNIVDPKWQTVGIGITYHGGRLWLTEDFSAVAGP